MHRPLLILALLLLPPTPLCPALHEPHSQEDAPLSDTALHTLIARVLVNQHADDQTIEFYERLEHRMLREHANVPALIEDKLYRVVPTGTGTVKVPLEDWGHSVDPALYRREMIGLDKALENSADPNNTRAAEDREKFLQRTRERREIVDELFKAYRCTWMGRENRGGRSLIKLHLDPNPEYRPSSRFTEFLRHGVATVWIDERAAQVARLDAELTSDVTFAGGVFGKIYRGGHMVLEQSEVEPGIWLPAVYQYDFVGRKFLFLFEIHERREISRYQRIGPPSEALAAIRRELSGTPPK
jgi:hypothetical protein